MKENNKGDMSTLRLYLVEYFDGSIRRMLAESLEDAMSYFSSQDRQEIKGITEIPQ